VALSRRFVGLSVGAVLGLALAAWRPVGSERASFDWLTWATEERGQTADAAVVVVEIDRALLKTHGVPGEARLKREGLAELVTRLAELKPRAIGLDVEFPSAREHAGDAQLLDAIAAAGDVTLPEAVVTLPGDGSALTLREPIAPFAEVARQVGFVTLHPDDDETVRRVGLVRTVNGVRRHHFALLAAAQMLGAEHIQVQPDRIMFLRKPPTPALVVPVDASAATWVRFTGDHPVPVVPGSELVKPGGPDARWRALVADRFALVGGVEEIFADHHRVPSARMDAHRQQLAGVLVLGQIISNVLEGRGVVTPPPWVGGLLLTALAMAGGWLAGTRRLMPALAGVVALAALAVLGSIHEFLGGVLVDAALLAGLPPLVFAVVRVWPAR